MLFCSNVDVGFLLYLKMRHLIEDLLIRLAYFSRILELISIFYRKLYHIHIKRFNLNHRYTSATSSSTSTASSNFSVSLYSLLSSVSNSEVDRAMEVELYSLNTSHQ